MAADYKAFLRSPGARRYYRQMKAGLGADASAPPSGANAALQAYIDSGRSAAATAPTRPDAGESDSFLTKTVDILSQLQYGATELGTRATAGVLKGGYDYAKSTGDTNPLGGILHSIDDVAKEVVSGGNPFGAGNDKIVPSDIMRGSERYRQSLAGRGVNDATIKAVAGDGDGDQGFLATEKGDHLAERIGKAAVGFSADVLLDPLTYVTLGGAGAVAKSLGTAAGRAGAERAGGALVRAGEGAMKVDNAVNQAIAHPIRTVKGLAARGKSAAPQAVEEVISPQAATKVIDEPKSTAEAVTKSADEIVRDDQNVIDFLADNSQKVKTPTPIIGEKLQRGLIPADRLIADETSILPYEGRKLKQTLRDKTPEDAIAHLKTGEDRYISPFMAEKVARTNTPPVEKVAAAAPEVQAQEAALAAIKPLATKPTDPEIKSWLSANPSTKINVSLPLTGAVKGTRTVEMTITEALKRTRMPGINAQVREALIKSLGTEGRAGVLRERAQTVASQAPEGVPEALAEAPRVTGAGRGSSPVEAAQDASQARAGRSVVQRSSREIDNIRKRYRRALSERAFDHLWDPSYLKDPNLTPAQKQREWEKRIREIRRGLKTEEPAYYEVFYAKQQSADLMGQAEFRDGPGRRANKAQPGSKSAAVNEQLAVIPTATQIEAVVDTSIEATERRVREADKILRGEHLSLSEWNVLRAISGNADLGHGATGQQWAGRAAEFDKTTNVQRTARDASVVGEGRGVNIESYNSKAQANAFRALLDDAITRIDANPPLRPNGKWDMWKRARLLREETTKSLVNIESFLRAHNIEPVMGTLKSGVPFSVGDMLKAMGSTRLGRQFLDARVFGGPWSLSKVKGYEDAAGTVYVDDLMRVFESIVDKLDGAAINAAGDGEDVLAAIAHSVVSTVKSGKVNRDTLADAILEGGKKQLTTAKPTFGGSKEALTEGGYPVNPASTPVVLKQLEDAILGADGDFAILSTVATAIQQRAAAHSIRFGDNVAELSKDTLDEVVDFISGTPSMKESIDLLSNPDAIVNRVAKATGRPYTAVERKAAQERVQEELGEIVSLWDQKGIASDVKVSKAVTRVEVNAGALDRMKEVARQIDEIPNHPEYASIADQTVQDVTTTWRRAKLWATDHFAASKVIDASTGRVRTNQLGREYARSHSNNVNFSQAVAGMLNRINRMGTTDEIAEAYRYVQRGMTGAVPPNVEAAAAEIKKVNNLFFESTAKGDEVTTGVMPTFLSSGFDISHVKDKLERAHFDFADSEKFDWDAIEALKTPMQRGQELQRQWAKMDVKDPISFMGKLNAALTSVNAEMSMSQNLSLKLRELGLSSTNYKPGYVLLKDTGSSPISRYFPEEQLWVDKEIVPDLQRLDKLMRETVQFRNEGLNKFINGTYAPILAAWKAGVTIWRPGHHVRNLVGDVSLSFLADGVKDPRYYVAASRMISNRARYEGVDLLRITQGMPTAQLGDGRSFGIRLSRRSKPVKISYDEAYDSAMRQGILKDFSVQEDLIEATDSPQWLTAIQQSRVGKPLGGRGKEFVGTVSQARDDFVRMAHYLHLLQKPGRNFKSQEELFAWAAARVDKVHPDGTGLTGFERKLRYIVPFYSWTRKSIPLVLEAAAQHPGRVLIAPKAMYNMAQANGLELESMSDPYPDDQLFPSWVTDSMTGPMYQDSEGNYWTAAPGDVATDTFGYLGSANPIGETLDMIAPFLKLPLELHTGETLGKGIQTPGRDPLEYIGQQIPGISHTQGLTGVDVLGSIPSLIQGEGLDDTMSVQRGNRDNLEVNQLLNFLTGVGSRNVSTPSTVNSAEIELRNRLREEREK